MEVLAGVPGPRDRRGTEGLRYGQRVRVLGLLTPAMMRTPEALAAFGPAAFGLDEPFLPVESRA